jgi:hypothetical protein
LIGTPHRRISSSDKWRAAAAGRPALSPAGRRLAGAAASPPLAADGAAGSPESGEAVAAG